MSNELKVEDFLAHYGVKGMRWGVRNSVNHVVDKSKSVAQNVKDRYNNLTPEQKRGAKIAGVSVLVVGAAAATVILAANGNTKAAAVAQKTVVLGKTLLDTVTRKPAMEPTAVADRVFNGVNLSKLDREINVMSLADMQKKASDYWTSDEGRSVAKNINLDISNYTDGILDRTRQRLEDPNYVWEL